MPGSSSSASTLPATWAQETGGGGRHIAYSVLPGVTVNGSLRLNGKVVKGINVKKAGDLIVIAPSVHASGNPYGSSTTCRWPRHRTDLVSLLKPRSVPSEGGSGLFGEREWSPERLARWYAGDVPPGEQNTELFSFIGLKHGQDVPVDLIIAEAWAGMQKFEQGVDEKTGQLTTRLDIRTGAIGRYATVCKTLPAGRSLPPLSEVEQQWAAGLVCGRR